MRRSVPISVVVLALAASAYSLAPAGDEPTPINSGAVVVEPPEIIERIDSAGQLRREIVPDPITSGAIVVEPPVDIRSPTGATREAAAERPSVRVVGLRHADAAALVEIVRTIWANSVLVAADPQTNSLIVRGGAEDLQEVLDLVEALDRAGPASPESVSTPIKGRSGGVQDQ